jgi:hypothetical protein
LNDGQIQNPSNPIGIVPLSNFAPRGFGFVHHSIAIFYHEVPTPNLTIRNFFSSLQGGEPTRALAMLRTMRDEAGVQPDVITYSALISACAKGQPRSSSGRSATVAEMAELIDVRASRQLGRLVRREREREIQREPILKAWALLAF